MTQPYDCTSLNSILHQRPDPPATSGVEHAPK